MLDVAPYQPDVRLPLMLDEEDEAEQLSITGRSRLPVDDEYARTIYDIQRAGLHHGRRLNQNMNHNAVDIARIQAGLDVRTTVGFSFPICMAALTDPFPDHAAKHPESC